MSNHQPLPQEESLEPPKKRASLSPGEILEEKEAEMAQLQDKVCVGEGIALGTEPQFLFPIYNSEPLPINLPLPGSPFTPTNLQSCFKSHLPQEGFLDCIPPLVPPTNASPCKLIPPN